MAAKDKLGAWRAALVVRQRGRIEGGRAAAGGRAFGGPAGQSGGNIDVNSGWLELPNCLAMAMESLAAHSSHQRQRRPGRPAAGPSRFGGPDAY
eukprot:SAG31_NODE_104_length_25069_cov_12.917144_16_plen_94_part_00